MLMEMNWTNSCLTTRMQKKKKNDDEEQYNNKQTINKWMVGAFLFALSWYLKVGIPIPPTVCKVSYPRDNPGIRSVLSAFGEIRNEGAMHARVLIRSPS